MSSKLKQIQLSSVDLVKRGANQKADIVLYKSADPINFDEGFDALQKSIASIMDSEESAEEKEAKLKKSLSEFKEYINPKKEGATEMKLELDLAKLSPEEQEQFNELAKKAGGELEDKPTADGNEVIKNVNESIESSLEENAVQGVELNISFDDLPESVQKSLKTADEFIEKSRKAEVAAVCKKYEILGTDVEKLTDDMYEMQKSSPEMYKKTVSILDKQVETLENSGLFAEIGKSGGQPGQGKAESIAKGLMEKDNTLTIQQAMAKAFELNPELIPEYDK